MRGVLLSSFLLLGALGGALATAHCGSFTEADSSADGGTVTPGDGGGGGADADAAGDAATMTGGDAGAFGGCATIIADGFERAVVTSSAWNKGPQSSNGGALALDTTSPFAGQNSLRVDVPTGDPRAYLEASLGRRSRVRYAFALRTDAPVLRTIVVNSIELDVSSAHFALYFALESGQLVLREQRFDQPNDPTADHTFGAVLPGWNNYALTLTLQDGAPAHVELDIDGIAKGGFDLTFPLKPGDVAVRCGVGFSDDGPVTHVWLDEIAVCAEP